MTALAMKEVKPEPKKPGKAKRFASSHSTSRELITRPILSGWTPRKVIGCRSMADNGQMFQLADLVETMFRDDRISGTLSTRIHGMLGLPVNFTGGDPKARKWLAGSQNRTGGFWEMHDESELAKLERWGLTLGVGFAQRIPLPRIIGRPQQYKIKTWHPRWFSYFYDLYQGAHWAVQTQQGMQPVVGGDGEWIVFQPYGESRPWAEGLWNALAFPWLLKQFSLEDRANYSETLGSPIWIGSTSPGSTEKQRNKFLNQLLGLGKNGKLVLPSGWDMKLVEAMSAGKSGDVFSQQIETSNEAETIIIAGQLVTTEGTSGFSNGSIFENITQDLVRFDAKRVSSCLHEQSIQPWALWNYGSIDAAPLTQWKTEKPEDIKEKAAGLSSFGDACAKIDAALKVHGLKIDAQKLVKDFNIPTLRVLPGAPSVPTPTDAAPPPAKARKKRAKR